VFALGTAALVAWFGPLEGFRFAHPWALLLGPLAMAFVIWVEIAGRGSRQGVFRYSRASEVGAFKTGLVRRLADLPLVLRLAAIALVALALARPQTSRTTSDVDQEGIDIVLALDLSGSMQETDLAPNRLEAAKLVIDHFVRQRPHDRLGLVVFGRDAFTHVPLTLDHGTFLRMLAELQLGLIDGRGTAIGNGLGVSLNRLRRSDTKSKVVILLTDGDNNAGNIAPLEAAKFAQNLGVKVYTILAGNSDPESAPPDPLGLAQTRRQPVNPKLLEEIASLTGGAAYLATDTRVLEQQFQRILEDLQKSRIKDRATLYTELFPRFVWPAFGLLLLELALRLTRFRRLP
jgi:Ca-activated chloride channel family protein